MAKPTKARKAAARRQRVEAASRSGPTPETARKLKPDPFNELCGRHILDGAQQRAGLEIRAIYRAVTAGVACRGGEMGGVRGGSGDMPAALAIARHERYLPWCNRWGHAVVEDVIDLVVNAVMPMGLAFGIEQAAKAGRDYDGGYIGRALADYTRRQTNG